MRLLCGDIGGTKTELSIFEGDGEPLHELTARRFPSADYPTFEALLDDFDTDGPVDAAAFGVAGPVNEGRCETTNLPWVLERAALSERLAAPVSIVNDFHAMALGAIALSPAQLLSLQAGRRVADGPVTVLGAGTGFGCAHVVRVDGQLRVLPSEAGHADFAPRDEDDEALLRFARTRTGGRVRVEDLVSGPGLGLVFDFVVASGLQTPLPETLAALDGRGGGDVAAVIGPRGVDGSDPACRTAVDRFVALYGAECGNVALRVLPTGGMFIAGGVGGRLRPRMEAGRFREAMCDKAPMVGLLQAIPVDLVLEGRTGLLGARAEAYMVCSLSQR